jgi:hypothetical protein
MFADSLCLPGGALRSLLEGSSGGCGVPAFLQKLLDGALLNAFLDTQFVVQKMIGNGSGAAGNTNVSISINAVDPNAIAVAIGADYAHFQVWFCGLPDGRFGSRGHGWRHR